MQFPASLPTLIRRQPVSAVHTRRVPQTDGRGKTEKVGRMTAKPPVRVHHVGVACACCTAACAASLRLCVSCIPLYGTLYVLVCTLNSDSHALAARLRHVYLAATHRRVQVTAQACRRGIVAMTEISSIRGGSDEQSRLSNRGRQVPNIPPSSASAHNPQPTLDIAQRACWD